MKRIYLKTTPNTISVPFNYQAKLAGSIHKWLGNNDLHGKISLYSYSWLLNGKRVEDGLNFTHGAKFFISFYEENYVKQIIKSILDDPDMFCGIKVTDISIAEMPDFSAITVFEPASPIFIQRHTDNKSTHYTYNDAEAGALLKETLLRKMKEAGLPDDETLHIQFDLSDPRRKTKLVHYRDIKNKANVCRVIIEGKPETKAFAWTVGLGSSTGIGFGALF